METPTPVNSPLYTQGKFWGGTVLPYWVFLIITALPFTGFFGIDHLLFRSPSTALLKGFSNVFTLGFWYFYDIVQAFTDKKFVKEYGLSAPVLGPQGLAMDYFRNITKEKDSLGIAPSGISSLLYFIAYIFTIFIPFGISNLFAGDRQGAIGKFIFSALTGLFVVLFIPYFFIFGFYELYRVIFKTQDVFEQGTVRITPLTFFMDKFGFAPNIMNPSSAAKMSAELAQKADEGGFYNTYIRPLFSWLPFYDAFDTAKCAVAPQIKQTVDAATTAVDGIKKVAEQVPQIATESVNKLAAFTDPAKLKEAAKVAAVAQLATQKGGGLLSEHSGWDGIILGGIALLILGGITVGLLRKYADSKQKTLNERARKESRNEAPPRPGTI